MPTVNDWNEKIIAEFRANEGRVGGRFEGAPIVLLHHRGRKSGREYVNPGDLHGGGEQAAEQFEQELTWEVVA